MENNRDDAKIVSILTNGAIGFTYSPDKDLGSEIIVNQNNISFLFDEDGTLFFIGNKTAITGGSK